MNVLMHKKSMHKSQQGATLITALTFLVLMTIVSVSASKISILDVLVSSNEQQQMMLFQDTENDLKELTTVVKLYKPLVKEGGATFDLDTGAYVLPSNTQKPGTLEVITDKFKRYQCGGFNGKAISIGPDVPPCDLYDFQVKTSVLNSGVRDRHHRGAGKEKPNPNKNSYL